MAAEETFGWYLYSLSGRTMTLSVMVENVNDGTDGWRVVVTSIQHSVQNSVHTIELEISHNDSANAPEQQIVKTTSIEEIYSGDVVNVKFVTNGGDISDQVTRFTNITVGQSPDTAFRAGGTS